MGLPVVLGCGSWCARRDGQVLGEQEGTCEVTMPDDDQHCLRLLCVGRGAAGPLACEVSNHHGTARCTLHLRLAGRCPHAGGAVPLCWGVASPRGAPSLCAMGGGGGDCPMGWHCSTVPHSRALLLQCSVLVCHRDAAL